MDGETARCNVDRVQPLFIYRRNAVRWWHRNAWWLVVVLFVILVALALDIDARLS